MVIACMATLPVSQIGRLDFALLILRERLALLHGACDSTGVVEQVVHSRAGREITEGRDRRWSQELRSIFLASRSGIGAHLRVACARLRRHQLLRLGQRGKGCGERVIVSRSLLDDLLERPRLKQFPPVRRWRGAEHDVLLEIARRRRRRFA
jgi:hypothetical protein